MMSYFNRNKWMTILVFVLVLINIATITAFWLLQGRRNNPPPPQHAMEFMVKELGFDSVQKQQLQELVAQHHRQVREIRSSNKEAKDAFFELLKQADVSDAALAVAAQKANVPDQQLEIITFRHFQKVRALCNEFQKKKFDSIIQEVLRMNAPGERPGPPPGEGNGMGPEDMPPPPGDHRRPPPQ